MKRRAVGLVIVVAALLEALVLENLAAFEGLPAFVQPGAILIEHASAHQERQAE